jgi:hypothetical protein
MTSTEAIRLVEEAAFDAAFSQAPPALQAFRNRHFTQRDYEATNVIACIAPVAPSDDWVPCMPAILEGLTQLELRSTGSGISYRVFGHL